jgi:hypothetical protein
MAVIRYSRGLTNREAGELKGFIPGLRSGEVWDPLHVLEVAHVLVYIGVARDELSSVFGVPENMVYEWTVGARSLQIRSRGAVIMSLELDERSKIYEARTWRGLVRAVAEESGDGQVRLIEPEGCVWRSTP